VAMTSAEACLLCFIRKVSTSMDVDEHHYSVRSNMTRGPGQASSSPGQKVLCGPCGGSESGGQRLNEAEVPPPKIDEAALSQPKFS
jgi:hypothetical protein